MSLSLKSQTKIVQLHSEFLLRRGGFHAPNEADTFNILTTVGMLRIRFSTGGFLIVIRRFEEPSRAHAHPYLYGDTNLTRSGKWNIFFDRPWTVSGAVEVLDGDIDALILPGDVAEYAVNHGLMHLVPVMVGSDFTQMPLTFKPRVF